MIAETANLATARNVVKEAAAIRNGKTPNSHPTNGADAMEAKMRTREQNQLGGCLTERLSGKARRITNLTLPVHGGPR